MYVYNKWLSQLHRNSVSMLKNMLGFDSAWLCLVFFPTTGASVLSTVLVLPIFVRDAGRHQVCHLGRVLYNDGEMLAALPSGVCACWSTLCVIEGCFWVGKPLLHNPPSNLLITQLVAQSTWRLSEGFGPSCEQQRVATLR
ncbi:hypothetical protein LX32DRAFT_328013 [Colletotrichum zoysiae]|uniref:Uncharacterized protein n=1 Tax=Colletotrichum zoysiae TaxID=1216348 RepID=A0AAD9M199_9PEZI|nr:hypothetical protein LX32DRAFT_328013 [Colletotrichum zoysiae]